MNSQEEVGRYDHFDALPDALVRLIFNKVGDAKSLCRCMTVSKRFASIIPEIDAVSLTISRRNTIAINKSFKESYDRNPKSSPRGLSVSFLKTLINKVITKPLQFVLRNIVPKSSSRCCEDDDGFSYHSPNEGLKSFNEIQSLQIVLPGHGGEIGSNRADSLLKWKAQFGSELESCVVLGATSLEKKAQNCDKNEEEQEQSELLFTDNELKLRVVWTISCLIAASARHHLLQQIVSDHQRLRSVVITDANKQGRLCMREEQIEELRRSVKSSEKLELSLPLERTPVPALKMRLWYVPVLELPASGCVMKGATLLVIRPVDGPKRVESDGDLFAGAFDGEEEEVFGEAVREMLKKKRTYTLEMNSF